jgi:hypothetical protein
VETKVPTCSKLMFHAPIHVPGREGGHKRQKSSHNRELTGSARLVLPLSVSLLKWRTRKGLRAGSCCAEVLGSVSVQSIEWVDTAAIADSHAADWERYLQLCGEPSSQLLVWELDEILPALDFNLALLPKDVVFRSALWCTISADAASKGEFVGPRLALRLSEEDADRLMDVSKRMQGFVTMPKEVTILGLQLPDRPLLGYVALCRHALMRRLH